MVHGVRSSFETARQNVGCCPLLSEPPNKSLFSLAISKAVSALTFASCGRPRFSALRVTFITREKASRSETWAHHDVHRANLRTCLKHKNQCCRSLGPILFDACSWSFQVCLLSQPPYDSTALRQSPNSFPCTRHIGLPNLGIHPTNHGDKGHDDKNDHDDDWIWISNMMAITSGLRWSQSDHTCLGSPDTFTAFHLAPNKKSRTFAITGIPNLCL